MPHEKRRNLPYIAVALVALAATLAFVALRRAPEPPPAGAIYYEGPMMNKAGTAYVTGDGRIVPTPPGSPPPGQRPRQGAIPR